MYLIIPISFADLIIHDMQSPLESRYYTRLRVNAASTVVNTVTCTNCSLAPTPPLPPTPVKICGKSGLSKVKVNLSM
jgi:hypothetical protein